MNIRTLYSRHVLHAHLGGWAPMGLRQFVATVAAINFDKAAA